LLLASTFLAAGDCLAQGPSIAVRRSALRAMVRVQATGCPGGEPRAGSGFAYRSSGQIVTAHHVVGGCQTIIVIYEGVAPGQPRRKGATIARVLARRDLAMLSVAQAPPVPALVPASGAINRDGEFAGLGYQGQPTASDVPVTFSAGDARLSGVLPDGSARALRASGSQLDPGQTVLRLNGPLQPGMSGGPIIDSNGRVIGIIAGGLKNGASSASWAWEGSALGELLSAGNQNVEVRLRGAFYSASELIEEEEAIAAGRTVDCGSLTLTYKGEKSFAEIAPTSDDPQRVEAILRNVGTSAEMASGMRFAAWSHLPSGATAVVPAGRDITKEGDVCVVHGPGTIQQVIWGQPAIGTPGVNEVSILFERAVMQPRAAYQFGFVPDFVLTTPGPQPGQEGMVFNRKAYSGVYGPGDSRAQTHFRHVFESLLARSDTFLGVATLNDMVPGTLGSCVALSYPTPQCRELKPDADEWIRFVLATQLSTYPAI
jgi:hypothetical protein